MTDYPMYLKKHRLGTYYYRRPVSKADQAFWRGSAGHVRREWSQSLGEKDRAGAIRQMKYAEAAYEAEREQQLAAFLADNPTEGPALTSREREQAAGGMGVTPRDYGEIRGRVTGRLNQVGKCGICTPALFGAGRNNAYIARINCRYHFGHTVSRQ